MTALPRWRRLAVKLSRHAAAMLPDGSPWAQAMRRELDYIGDDRAALGWALGCVLASYRLASCRVILTTGASMLRRLSAGRHPLMLLRRHAAVSAALMLAVGLAFLENAGGQTAPPPVHDDETVCGDMAGDAVDSGPDRQASFSSALPRARGQIETGWPVPAAPAAETPPCSGRHSAGTHAPEFITTPDIIRPWKGGRR
jgi:hypothetical protein